MTYHNPAVPGSSYPTEEAALAATKVVSKPAQPAKKPKES